VTIWTVTSSFPRGRDLLRDPRYNRGTAFTAQERSALGLQGLLLAAVQSLEEQAIERYSHEYRRPDGVYLSIDDIDGVESAFRNYGLSSDDVDLKRPAGFPAALRQAALGALPLEHRPARGPIGLAEVVAKVHPTIMVGTSTAGGAFTEPILREMAKHVQRPMIFPLSNPTERIEALPRDVISGPTDTAWLLPAHPGIRSPTGAPST